MWPDRLSNPGPLTYESGALPIALRGPAVYLQHLIVLMHYALQNVCVTLPISLDNF